MQDRLIFLVSAPRSGSTLLQRMLASHTQIATHPEPHLITPLAYLGYYDTVDKAPFDHVNSAEALRLFVSHLPNGEADYLASLRAYSDSMFGRFMAAQSKLLFLDKTPANALVLPFLQRLYPQAKYVVLTRHPLAVFSSYANSFFAGDWHAAHRFNPILERYVPAIAAFVREAQVPHIQVVYEDLVRRPEFELQRLFEFLGLNHQPQAVDYGKHFKGAKGPGDPINVDAQQRPVTNSLDCWAAELAESPVKLRLAEAMISALAAEDLGTWGFPVEGLLAPLHQHGDVDKTKRRQRRGRQLGWYGLQRRLLLALKKDIHQKSHGRLLRRVRYFCDVLLRE